MSRFIRYLNIAPPASHGGDIDYSELDNNMVLNCMQQATEDDQCCIIIPATIIFSLFEATQLKSGQIMSFLHTLGKVPGRQQFKSILEQIEVIEPRYMDAGTAREELYCFRFLVLIHILIANSQFISFFDELDTKYCDRHFTGDVFLKDTQFKNNIFNIIEIAQIRSSKLYLQSCVPLLVRCQEKQMELLQKFQTLVRNIPDNVLIFTYDTRIAELTLYLQQLLGDDNQQVDVRLILNFQQSLCNIMKQKQHQMLDLFLEHTGQSADDLKVLEQSISTLLSMLQQAGYKLGKRSTDVNFGVTQQGFLVCRFLLSNPQVLTALFADIGGLLDEKLRMYGDVVRMYKNSASSLKFANFNAQMAIQASSLLANKQIMNVHNLCAFATVIQNNYVDRCMENHTDGYNIILLKVGKLLLENSAGFNIVNYYRVVQILIRLLGSCYRGKRGSILRNIQLADLSLANKAILEARDFVESIVEEQQISDDEYNYMVIFQLLNRGALHTIFEPSLYQDKAALLSNSINEECFLTNMGCMQYLYFELSQLQKDYKKNKKLQKEHFNHTAFIQKERMLVSLLSVLQERETIQRAKLDFVEGSFISSLVQEMQDGSNQIVDYFCNNSQIIAQVASDLCRYFSDYKYTIDPIEYTQEYDDEELHSAISSRLDAQISSPDELKVLFRQLTQVLVTGAVVPPYPTLAEIIHQDDQMSRLLSDTEGTHHIQTVGQFLFRCFESKLVGELFHAISQNQQYLIRKYLPRSPILSRNTIAVIQHKSNNALTVVDQGMLESIKQEMLDTDTQSDQTQTNFSLSMSLGHSNCQDNEPSDDQHDDVGPSPAHHNDLQASDTLQQAGDTNIQAQIGLQIETSKLRQLQILKCTQIDEMVSNIEHIIDNDAISQQNDAITGLQNCSDESSGGEFVVEQVSEQHPKSDSVQGFKPQAQISQEQINRFRRQKIYYQRVRTTNDTMEHQNAGYLCNYKPFVNNNIVLEQIFVDADILEQQNYADSNVSHITNNFYTLSDEEKLISLNKEMVTRQIKEHSFPIRQQARKVSFEEKFRQNNFLQKIENMVQYKLSYNEDDQRSLVGMCSWNDVLQNTGNLTNCLICGQPLDITQTSAVDLNLEFSGDGREASDTLMNREEKVVFCTYMGKWLCSSCSGGRTLYQSIAPNNIDGGYYKVSGVALSQIHKAWLDSIISNQKLLQHHVYQSKTSQMRKLIVDCQVQLNQLYTLHTSCAGCPIYQRCQQAIGDLNIQQNMWKLADLDSFIEGSSYVLVNRQLVEEYNKQIRKNNIFLKKYSRCDYFKKIPTTTEFGNYMDKIKFRKAVLILHISKCERCAGLYYICDVCKQPVAHQATFECIARVLCEEACSHCSKPIHGRCLYKHKCNLMKEPEIE